MFSRFVPGAIVLAVMSGAALAQTPQGRATVVFAIFDNPEDHHGCIVRERSRDGGWDQLVLGRCDNPAGLFIFDERAKRIRAAANPNLCMSDTTGAGAAPFNAILRDCNDNSLGQFYTYNRRSQRIVGLDSDDKEAPDGYCYFVGPQRGQRSMILNAPCRSRMASAAQVAFFMTPRGAGAPPAAQAYPSPSQSLPAAAGLPPIPQAPPQVTRAPWGKTGAWTIESSSSPKGFSACRAIIMSNSGEIRIGLNAALEMTMSTPVDRVVAPPGTRTNVSLRVGNERETAPAGVNPEGRLGFNLPLSLARTMVERTPREMFVEGPDGMSSVPMAGFRAVWDELNACVNAQGRR